MSLKNYEQEKSQKEIAQEYLKQGKFSRELLAVASQGIKQKDKETVQQPQTEKTPQETTLTELKNEMNNIAYLKAVRADEARQDKEVDILLATVMNIATIQESFTENMLVKFDELNRRQLNLLSVQSEYAKNVRNSTDDTIKSIYYQFRGEQEQAFTDIRKFLANDTEQMIKKVNSAAKNAEKAADRILEMKKAFGMRCTLDEIGVKDEDIRALSEKSMHPNMLNNPVKMTVDSVEEMYRALK
ncbi:MAG: iron-containing alcohol dehydrogenase [Ruminococcus sp.]|nr:iron-containing alcohol dehydrogenase [Ruminococcus sp.]